MKRTMRLGPVLAVAAFLAVTLIVSGAEQAPAKPWRGGWCSLGQIDDVIACAVELQFNALIAHGPEDRMKAFTDKARERGIESYYWIYLNYQDPRLEAWRQVMTPVEEQRAAELQADKDPAKGGYQSGGEPLPGKLEVLTSRLLCFHRAEVRTLIQDDVRRMVEACPSLTGVGFDYFGYQNYRCCLCPHSMKLFAEFRRQRPELAEEEALVRFSLDTLVDFNNELAAYVRTLRPGLKVATHVYPVFLPDPLYGNRLDVDYCCQTVAWFFKPYWSAEKIQQYTRVVVNEANRHHKRPQGIPFIGVYVGRPIADKPPDRLAEELRLVREAGGTQSLSVCSFNEFVKHAPHRKVMREALSVVGP